jgi:hypothetical protein
VSGKRHNLERLLRSAYDTQRREETLAVVLSDMPARKTPQKSESFQPKDIISICLGISTGLALLPLAPKLGRGVTAGALVVMFLALLYPTKHAVTSMSVRPRKSFYLWTIVFLVDVGLIVAFGLYAWPPLRRHHLTAKETQRFEQAIKNQKAKRDVIRLYCPQSDESACTYAVQFISVFGEAGWDAGYLVERVSLTKPTSGVLFLLPTTAKKSDLQKWNSGGWTSISPSMKHIRQAFLTIEVEPDSTADPDIPEGTMGIYFGNEKGDASEPTQLTDTMKRSEEIRRSGQFPMPNDD